MSQSDDAIRSDPRPLPPREPALEECCGGGCTPCVFDRYAEALERYEVALADWLKRHPEAGPASSPG
ncbi:MAG TPA: oxidoreductase-like domain-containing protein [Burkholderiales bacterium]|nr:oxidoreductase-like domain-containing protein [Burkholderiales bacterium]